tara:strand:+ start:1034 stop:2047 length:1014 start_codon:yes stop_codon:yes gene_type:complete
LDKLSATATKKFLDCTKNYHFQISKEYNSFPNLGNEKLYIGNLVHFVLEKYFEELNTISNRESIEKIAEKFIVLKNSGLSPDYLKTIDGTVIISKILKIIKAVTSIDQFETYNLETEYEFPATDLFKGKIDLFMISKSKIILIDYKTGKFIDKNTNDISPSIKNQFRVYQILASKKYPDREITSILIDKNGKKFDILFDELELIHLKDEITRRRNLFTDNKFEYGDSSTCFNCSYAAYCEKYQFDEHNEIEEKNFNIQASVLDQKEENGSLILNLKTSIKKFKNYSIKLIIEKESIENQQFQIVDSQILNINRPYLLKQEDGFLFFKLGFGQITTKT